jgi:hypothetical protein
MNRARHVQKFETRSLAKTKVYKMKRSWIPVVVVLILAIGAIVFWYFTHTTIAPPAPPAGPEIHADIPAATSHLQLPASFNTVRLRDLIDQALNPKTISGTANDDWKIDYTLNIGNISLSTDPAANHVLLTLPFSGHVQVERSVLGVHVGVGSDGSGTGKVSASPIFKEDWSIDPRADISVSVPTWNVHTALGDVGVAGLVEGKARDALNANRGKIEAAIANELKLHDKVEQYWNKLPTVIKVSDEPPTWVRIKPQSVGVKKLQYTANAIKSGVELSLEAAAFLSNSAPEKQTAPLPNLTVKDELSNSFSIIFPIQAAYDVINSQLSAAIAKNSLTIPDVDAWVRFTSCTIEPYGSGMLLKVNFNGKKGWLSWVSGHLYFTAKAHFDPTSEQLTFEDLVYTAETNSALLTVANWLISPLILDELKKGAVVNIAPEMKRAKDKANQQFERLKAGLSGVSANVNLSELKIANMVFTKEGPIVVIQAEGTMDAELQ